MKKILFIFCLMSGALYPQWYVTHNPSTSESLTSIYFVNNDDGWIAGTHGTVFKTTNGGEEWQSLNTNYNGTITKIFFIDENNGWAFNTEGTFLITSDGGLNWESQNLSTGIKAISFVSKDIGWLTSTTKGILKTTDGILRNLFL